MSATLLPKNKAIHQFWSSFEMPAYRDTSVPDGVAFPYLTYQYSTAAFGKTAPITVKMWFYTSSEDEADTYAEALSSALSCGGKQVLFEGGSVLVSKGTPFCIAQNGQEDNNLKLRYFNINMTFNNED